MNKIKFSIIFMLLAVTLTGCSGLKGRSQGRNMLSAISAGSLKGMDKVEVIKEFGQPVATSKSDASECWYYARPKSIWLWFKGNNVDHWEVE